MERGADQASVGCTGNMCPAGRVAAEPARGTTVWGERLTRPSGHSSPLGHSGTRDVD